MKIIEADSFYNCKSLTSVTIPPSVTEIRARAFFDCQSLASITLPTNLTVIGNEAFQGCTSLKSIIIPSAVTTIEGNAFNNCENLTVISFPASLTTLGAAGVFMNCKALTTITVAEENPNYKSVDGVLMSRDGTTLIQYPASKPGDSYTIPSSVTTLRERVFQYNRNLRSLTIPPTVTMCMLMYSSEGESLPFSLTIAEGHTAIPDRAFVGCSRLTELTLPSTLTSIGYNAFGGCSSLPVLNLPDNLETIGETAFSNCEALTTITIPAKVTSIGNYAFNYGNVQTVYVQATTPPSLGVHAFRPRTGSTLKAIYVPAGYAQTYKDAAGWSAYADYIQ